MGSAGIDLLRSGCQHELELRDECAKKDLDVRGSAALRLQKRKRRRRAWVRSADFNLPYCGL